MKNTLGVITLNLLLAGCFSACGKQPQAAEENGARVALLSNHWDTSTSNRTIAELDGRNWSGPLPALEDITKGFSIRFNADFSIPNRDRCLLQIPGVLDVCLRQHNPLIGTSKIIRPLRWPMGRFLCWRLSSHSRHPWRGKWKKCRWAFPWLCWKAPWEGTTFY